MRFAFFVPRYHTNLHYQVKALQTHGHEVSMFSLYKGGSEEHSAVQPVVLGYSKLFHVFNKLCNPQGGKLIKNSFELKYGFPPLIKLWRAIRRANSDVCVVKNVENLYSFFVFVFALILRKRVVVILHIAKFRPQRKSGSVALLNFFNIPVITPVLGDPQFPNDNENLVYIPFPISAEPFTRTYCENGEIRIICVGKFQERKEQLLLVRAVEALRKKYKVSLTLVGQEDESAYKKRLEAYIKEHQLQEMVHVVPHQPWDAMDALYRKHDIFVIPSYDELASFALVEAMRAGLAVISSDDNGSVCYIREGENGYVFKTRDLHDLTRALEKLVSDESRIRSFGEKSLKITLHDHSLDAYYTTFMEALQ